MTFLLEYGKKRCKFRNNQQLFRKGYVVNKTAIKKMFHDEGIQVNVLALNIVERLVRYVIESMIIGAKFKKVKRVKPSNIQKISDEEIKAMLVHMDDRPFKIYDDYIMDLKGENYDARYEGKDEWFHASGAGLCMRKHYFAQIEKLPTETKTPTRCDSSDLATWFTEICKKR